MSKFTFLEVHFHDADFSANAPFSNQSPDELPEDADESAADSDAPETDDSSSLVPLLVLVGVLALLAVVVKKLLGDTDLEDIEDIEAEADIDIE